MEELLISTPSILTAKDIILKTPVPLKTESYSPIPHGRVIDMTMEQLDKANLKIADEHYITAKDGKQAMGFYTMEGTDDKDMGMRLIWHNSYDKTMSLKWAIGAKVFVCSNGVVSGDIGSFKRKHTGEALLDYENAVRTYVNKAGDMFRMLVNDKERMKEIQVTKRTCAELVGRMYLEESIVTSTQLNIIKRELDMEKPSFDYQASGSLWELYNHVTLSLKEAHPLTHLNQHMDLHKFVKEEYAL